MEILSKVSVSIIVKGDVGSKTTYVNKSRLVILKAESVISRLYDIEIS